MIQTEDISEVMDLRAQSICKRTFLQERPNAVTEPLDEFIVVSLPYSEVNRTMGETDDWWLDMTVVYEIYVADRQTASNPKELNVPRMKALKEAVRSLFPIIDDERRFKIVRPRVVVPASSDGNGYHYCRIQAKMTTMV